MSKLLLETKRLTIRNFRPQDAAAMVARMTHPEVARFMTWDSAIWEDEEKVQAWIAKQRGFGLAVLDAFLEFAVEKDGVNIGDVAVKRFSRDPSLAEVGWSLHPDFQGQGYATEAASALMDWAFYNLDVRRITSLCDAKNVRSYKLMARLGMRREALHLKSSLIQGAWVDDLICAVLKEEWEERPRPNYRVRLPLAPLEVTP